MKHTYPIWPNVYRVLQQLVSISILPPYSNANVISILTINRTYDLDNNDSVVSS